jgi:hypothetical protein
LLRSEAHRGLVAQNNALVASIGAGRITRTVHAQHNEFVVRFL